MKLSRAAKRTLLAIMAIGFTFIYLPLLLVVINSFNTNKSFAWPPTGFTTEWWSKAAVNEGIRDAVMRSFFTALIATSIALILGSLAAAAITRYDFFGRNTISLLF
ncbi:MAG: ABC transporter permease, partial [Actinobacteria bacterium]|nr:ABC transporter permease [Actinomycetota bacterium]